MSSSSSSSSSETPSDTYELYLHDFLSASQTHHYAVILHQTQARMCYWYTTWPPMREKAEREPYRLDYHAMSTNSLDHFNCYRAYRRHLLGRDLDEEDKRCFERILRETKPDRSDVFFSRVLRKCRREGMPLERIFEFVPQTLQEARGVFG
ncbi:hypothetical protein BJX61DRAFT_546061 [Aspergillus egyptiacus]|nr:hypothetical protein BJX61DRAFT_546061 [Aspergillus egyptiacus]